MADAAPWRIQLWTTPGTYVCLECGRDVDVAPNHHPVVEDQHGVRHILCDDCARGTNAEQFAELQRTRHGEGRS